MKESTNPWMDMDMGMDMGIVKEALLEFKI